MWPTYEAYLASPEWQEQRRRAFQHFGYRCMACPARAEQIHHGSYRDPWGKERRVHLIPVCASDHEAITQYIEDHKGEASMYQLTWRYIFSVRRNLRVIHK